MGSLASFFGGSMVAAPPPDIPPPVPAKKPRAKAGTAKPRKAKAAVQPKETQMTEQAEFKPMPRRAATKPKAPTVHPTEEPTSAAPLHESWDYLFDDADIVASQPSESDTEDPFDDTPLADDESESVGSYRDPEVEFFKQREKTRAVVHSGPQLCFEPDEHII